MFISHEVNYLSKQPKDDVWIVLGPKLECLVKLEGRKIDHDSIPFLYIYKKCFYKTIDCMIKRKEQFL